MAKKSSGQCKLHCCALTKADKERIAATMDGYHPGKWAEENAYGPACHCGLRAAKEVCPRHGTREHSD